MVKSFRGRSLASSVRSSQEDSAPQLNPETDFYAKVSESRGKGQFVVSLPDTTVHHLYMPPKFRNALWIRRGSFIIIRRYTESNELELLHVLSVDQIKELKKEGKWPVEFFIPVLESESEELKSESESESESDIND